MAFVANVVPPEDLYFRLDANYYGIDALEDEKKIRKISYDYLENRIKNMASGATPKGANYLDQGVIFIRTQNVQDNIIDVTDKKYISKDDNQKLKRSQLRENDVILTITGANLGRAAVVSEKLLPANINQHSVRMETKKLDPHFLSIFLNSKYGQSQIWRRVYGATRPALSYEEIKDMIVATPKSEIQQFIGNKVRKAEELREEAKEFRDEALAILHPGIGIEKLSEMLRDCNKKYNWVNPNNIFDRIDSYFYKEKYVILDGYIDNFNSSEISEVASVEYGYMPMEEYGDAENGIPMIRITNMVGDLLINGDNMKFIPINEKIKKKHFVQDGDLLLVQLGDTTGKVALVTPEYEGHLFPSFCLKISILNNEKVLPGYMALLFESDIIQMQILQTISYSSVRPNTTKPAIEGIKIPLLPITQQTIISDKVTSYLKYISLSKKLIAQAKQDVEDLIEGKFDESKISEGV